MNIFSQRKQLLSIFKQLKQIRMTQEQELAMLATINEGVKTITDGVKLLQSEVIACKVAGETVPVAIETGVNNLGASVAALLASLQPAPVVVPVVDPPVVTP
jgi:hypothetical protein